MRPTWTSASAWMRASRTSPGTPRQASTRASSTRATCPACVSTSDSRGATSSMPCSRPASCPSATTTATPRSMPGGRVTGHGMFVGLRMGFEYGGHDYDRDRARPSDIVTIASPLGVATEHVWTHGGVEIRTSLDLSGAISSVTPYAFSAYQRDHALTDVLTPVREQGYYHAFAVTAAPTVEISIRRAPVDDQPSPRQLSRHRGARRERAARGERSAVQRPEVAPPIDARVRGAADGASAVARRAACEPRRVGRRRRGGAQRVLGVGLGRGGILRSTT